MSSKRKDLTSGMVVTQKQEDCKMFVDDAGCMQYVLVCASPNPTKPTEPIVQYFVDGVEVPKPGDLLPCLEHGTTKPVFVMGGKLAVEGLLDALNELIEEQRKDTPITKNRYCNKTTGTWWEKICVVEKQPDNSYQVVVVSDTDTLETCTGVTNCTPAISEIFGATTTPAEFTAIAVHNPSCCEVAVVTSAGNFTIKPNEHGWTDSFDCAVTLQSITITGTGNCDPNTVHTILTKRF